jgi:hypothetical protein
LKPLEVGQAVTRKRGPVGDGQRGHVIQMEDGRLGVQLDRVAEKLVFPLDERGQEWILETVSRLQPMQAARVAYAADRELRMAHGEYGAKDWMSMSEPDRVAWMQRGAPVADNDRRALYEAIKLVLGGMG